MRNLIRSLRAGAYAGAVTIWRHREDAAVQLLAVLIALMVLAATGGFHSELHAQAGALAGAGLAFGITLDDIATTAITSVQETFKRVYLMAVDAVPDSTPLTAQLNRTRKFKAGPDGLYFNVKLQTGGAVANVPDAKLLPRATRPVRKQGKAGLAHTYTVVAIGGQSIPLTADTRNAFVGNLEDNLEDGMIRVRNDLERQYNSDGAGILCVLKVVSGAPTYTVEKPYGKASAGPGTMLLIEDMDVAILNSANGTERGRTTISSIDPDNEQVTLADSVSGAAIGDLVVLCNDKGATGSDKTLNYNNEASGILAAIGTSTFENIDPSTAGYRRWRSTVYAVSAALSQKHVAVLEARVKAKSGEIPDLHYTTDGIAIGVMDTLAGNRRYDGATMELKGGYTGLNLQGKKVLTGVWCPKGYYFAINTGKNKVGMVDLVKMGYVDLDGAKLHRVEGRHAYRADLWMPHQAIWFSRNAHGVATGLTDDNTIVRY